MKKIKFAIVGYGNRGQVYADYSLIDPKGAEIVAVIDPNNYKLQVAKERYGLSENQIFSDYTSFLKSNVTADVVINATMECDHYKTAIEILNSGHHMIIEKPIVYNKDELMQIKQLAIDKNLLVFVCHVLRYSPFYKEIKEITSSGKIGKIVSIEMNEHVWIPHYITSYVRGKWNNQEVCGSPILLAKCCHDMDLVCWLNSATTPQSVMSYKHLSHFNKQNKPQGATEYCYNCPHEKTCDFSAIKMYYQNDVMPFLVWDSLNKPLDQITPQEKLNFLKTSVFGKCVYGDCNNNVADRQNLIINFNDQSVATFTLSCGTCMPDRYIHIVGTKGEIEGKLEENKFVLRTYDSNKVRYNQEIINVSSKVINKAIFGGHNGGDYGIMHDIVNYFNGNTNSPSMTLLNDSVISHLLVYSAEESCKTQKAVKVL